VLGRFGGGGGVALNRDTGAGGGRGSDVSPEAVDAAAAACGVCPGCEGDAALASSSLPLATSALQTQPCAQRHGASPNS